MFDHEFVSTILRLSLALFAGGIVGIERSYHGRSAGFREHTLVCVSGCLLMLLAEFQPHIGAWDFVVSPLGYRLYSEAMPRVLGWMRTRR